MASPTKSELDWPLAGTSRPICQMAVGLVQKAVVAFGLADWRNWPWRQDMPRQRRSRLRATVPRWHVVRFRIMRNSEKTGFFAPNLFQRYVSDRTKCGLAILVVTLDDLPILWKIGFDSGSGVSRRIASSKPKKRRKGGRMNAMPPL